MNTGILYLIPTPLADDLPLEPSAFNLLDKASSDLGNHAIYIEDHKPARRRWISWGLDRDVITHFIQYNEHNMNETLNEAISKLSRGINILLMSDGGLPAFCDPGAKLVRRCHESGIRVKCLPHHNSISQAIALCGFECNEFHFYGFPPRKSELRESFFQKISQAETTAVLMDTPYRLKKTLEELKSIGLKKKVFLATNLNAKNEMLYFGNISKILSKLVEEKAEFILIIE